MNEFGVVAAAGVVRFERLLPGPIERIWAYLVESEKRREWFARGEIEPRVGGKAELFFLHSELSDVPDEIPEKYKGMENGVGFTGRVTVYEPPRRLAITWSESWGDESEVLFELAPKGEDVLLTLTHSRLPNRAEMVNVSTGWHTHLGVLADRLHGREREGFWSRHARIEGVYDERYPD